MSIVEELKAYLENDFNILLRGKHGTGKTEQLRQACDQLGLTTVYYSASTLDPFTDLVGVPFANDDKTDLLNVRPHRIDQAQVVFFDELNRAEDKTLNAVMEVTQFQTINDEPLPNLKCVIAAINPADAGEYSVSELDPALLDRFLMTIDMDEKPDRRYLSTKLGADVAAALCDWHRGRKAKSDYCSPRRLEYIGHVYSRIPKKEAIKAAMPPGAFNYGELFDMLQAATGQGKGGNIDYGKSEPTYIKNEALPSSVAGYMDADTTTAEDRLHVIKALRNGIGAEPIIDKWEPVLDRLTDAELDTLFETWNPTKKSLVRTKAKSIKDTNQKLADAILNALS